MRHLARSPPLPCSGHRLPTPASRTRPPSPRRHADPPIHAPADEHRPGANQAKHCDNALWRAINIGYGGGSWPSGQRACRMLGAPAQQTRHSSRLLPAFCWERFRSSGRRKFAGPPLRAAHLPHQLTRGVETSIALYKGSGAARSTEADAASRRRRLRDAVHAARASTDTAVQRLRHRCICLEIAAALAQSRRCPPIEPDRKERVAEAGLAPTRLSTREHRGRPPCTTLAIAAWMLSAVSDLRRGGPFAAVETGPNGTKRFGRSYGAHRSRRFQS